MAGEMDTISRHIEVLSYEDIYKQANIERPIDCRYTKILHLTPPIFPDTYSDSSMDDKNN